MQIKSSCTKCGKTIWEHSDWWLSDKYSDEKLIKLRIDIVNQIMQWNREKRNECHECFFMIKERRKELSLK